MNSMTDIERLLHEHACARLCIEFAHFIDAREHERFLDLFTDDGVLDRLGEVFDGKAAIADMLAARSPQLFTRHLCTDIVVDVHSDTHASGSSRALFHKAMTGTQTGYPLTCEGAPAVAEYHDCYSRVSGRWKLARRVIRLAFA